MVVKNILIIDTDCGIDDALAIFLALASKSTWKILAITCVNGNTTVDNVCNNVLKVLHLCNETKIPVYRGCDRPLVWPYKTIPFHGKDGLANMGQRFSSGSLQISAGHAANILVQLSQQYQTEDLHLVALGPLTNVAMAHRLDPNFTIRLKSITALGGNIQGMGNTTSAAEFNFGCDPESALIVFKEAKCPVTMIPMETAIQHGMNRELQQILTTSKSPISRFCKLVLPYLAKMCKEEGHDNIMDYDFLAIAALMYPECIGSHMYYPVSVETTGHFTRGQAVIERIPDPMEKRKDVRIITDFKDDILNHLRECMVKLEG